MNQKKNKNSSSKTNNATRQTKEWSNYQKAIFNDVENGTGHTLIVARAGSGKTSTLIEALYHVPKNCKTLMIAFNKKIAEELKARVPSSIETSTLHSLGFKILRTAWGTIQLDNNKCFNIVKDLLGNQAESYDTINSICRTVSLCKGYLSDTPDKIDEIIDQFGIDTFELDRQIFISYVIQALRYCKEKRDLIDFDDMIWLPIVYNLIRPNYDRVFIDESQDLNASQIAMALMACKKSGRICAVGDPEQSIYAFRGADSDAMDKIKEKLNAKTLPLSVTYRCGKSIVKVAQEIVPDIETFDKAKDGLVEKIPEADLLKKVKVGDFVLSRTNAPLIKYCLMLLRNGTPANIQGRDIGANLLALVNKSKKKQVDKFLDWLDDWKEKEVARLLKKRRSTTEVEDKYLCLVTLCEGAKAISDVKSNIAKLFSDDDDSKRVILSTAHRAKGLERSRVFILTGTFRKGMNKEENNIYYVAVTRAKDELYLVQPKSSNKQEYKDNSYDEELND